MKTYIIILLGIVSLSSCIKTKTTDPSCDEPADISKFVSPILDASTPDAPFSGILEVYPAKYQSSLYLGNYSEEGKLTPFPGYYVIKEGGIFNSGRPLLLPEGQYTLVYWGLANDLQYSDPLVTEPSLTLTTDLNIASFSLKQSTLSGGLYAPTFAFVYSRKDLTVGQDSIHVDLSRAVASLAVIVKNDDGTPLDNSISSITAQLSNVHKQLDLYTAEPKGDLVTVNIPLTISSDRTQAYNLPAMVFPTTNNPPIEIIVKFSDGAIITRKANLTNTLTAGVRLKLEVTLSKLLSPSGEPVGFKVNPWLDENEKLEF